MLPPWSPKACFISKFLRLLERSGVPRMQGMKWPRFALRTMLIAVFALSVCFGLWRASIYGYGHGLPRRPFKVGVLFCCYFAVIALRYWVTKPLQKSHH